MSRHEVFCAYKTAGKTTVVWFVLIFLVTNKKTEELGLVARIPRTLSVLIFSEMQFRFGLQYLKLVTFWDYWLATGISALWNIPAFSSVCICIYCRRWNASLGHAMTLLSDLGADVLLRPISSSCASRHLLLQYAVCNLTSEYLWSSREPCALRETINTYGLWGI